MADTNTTRGKLWDRKRIEEFLACCAAHTLTEAARQFGLSPKTASCYYRRFRSTDTDSNEGSEPSRTVAALTKEELRDLKRLYPHHENVEVARMLALSLESLRRYARNKGLLKSKSFQKEYRRRMFIVGYEFRKNKNNSSAYD